MNLGCFRSLRNQVLVIVTLLILPLPVLGLCLSWGVPLQWSIALSVFPYVLAVSQASAFRQACRTVVEMGEYPRRLVLSHVAAEMNRGRSLWDATTTVAPASLAAWFELLAMAAAGGFLRAVCVVGGLAYAIAGIALLALGHAELPLLWDIPLAEMAQQHPHPVAGLAAIALHIPAWAGFGLAFSTSVIPRRRRVIYQMKRQLVALREDADNPMTLLRIVTSALVGSVDRQMVERVLEWLCRDKPSGGSGTSSPRV